MYNRSEIQRLAGIVHSYDGRKNKDELGKIIQSEFNLSYEKPLYVGKYFTLRFSKGQGKRFDNTVLALSKLKKYDDSPFIVCVVSEDENHLLLANTTFIKKISHSSKELRVDNIRGSFNGSDIYKEYIGMKNAPQNFEKLFAIHEDIDLKENLERLVEETNNIKPQEKRIVLNDEGKAHVLDSVQRSQTFIDSEAYKELEKILADKVRQVNEELNLLAQTDNVNLRGRRIEYLVTTDYQATEPVRKAILEGEAVPAILTPNDLGDFTYQSGELRIEVDIKTKLANKASEPKGYNVDKLLELLAQDHTIFMLCIILIDPETREIKTKLTSPFDQEMLAGTIIQHHWAGRDSRGVAQFNGHTLERKVKEDKPTINIPSAQNFLKELMEL